MKLYNLQSGDIISIPLKNFKYYPNKDILIIDIKKIRLYYNIKIFNKYIKIPHLFKTYILIGEKQ